MKKGYILLCLSLAAVFVVSAAGTTLAVWRKLNSSDYLVGTATVSGQIVEEYEGAEGIYPGKTTQKVVNVQNTGTVDSIVRVKVEKAWGTQRDQNGNLAVDGTISTDNILIDYNTEYWQYDETDGYFYYKGVLEPGQLTLQPLFQAFTIDKESTGSEYAGLTADIWVKMECVQAGYEGPAIWDKTLADLGITYTEPEKEQVVTKVEYQSPGNGFVFTATDENNNTESVQDLFFNFKDLLPGETASQTITVSNGYDQETEIFLRAESVDQNLSPEQMELVNKLLWEYTTIVVTDDTGHVLYDGPIWGNLDGTGNNLNTMKNDISLGLFAAGQSKGLNIQLQIDPGIGNEYQGLLGLIRWVWSAQGDETPTPPPQTGDESNVALYAALTIGSAVAMMFLLVFGRRQKREQEDR